jgi:hypothetical protein
MRMKTPQGWDGNSDGGPEPPPSLDRSDGTGGVADSFSPVGIRDDYAELLHGLNNALVSMLLNVQVMEWKLPSYSRLKRNLHEIERNAQRGGELVKRLLQRLDAVNAEHLTARPVATDVATLSGAVLAMADEGRDAGIQAHELPARSTQLAAGAGSPHRK